MHKIVNGEAAEMTAEEDAATRAEWAATAAAKEADLAANGYKYLRKKAYPPLEEQFDKIYHDGLEGWKTMILAIKEQFPKPT